MLDRVKSENMQESIRLQKQGRPGKVKAFFNGALNVFNSLSRGNRNQKNSKIERFKARIKSQFPEDPIITLILEGKDHELKNLFKFVNLLSQTEMIQPYFDVACYLADKKMIEILITEYLKLIDDKRTEKITIDILSSLSNEYNDPEFFETLLVNSSLSDEASFIINFINKIKFYSPSKFISFLFAIYRWNPNKVMTEFARIAEDIESSSDIAVFCQCFLDFVLGRASPTFKFRVSSESDCRNVLLGLNKFLFNTNLIVNSNDAFAIQFIKNIKQLDPNLRISFGENYVHILEFTAGINLQLDSEIIKEMEVMQNMCNLSFSQIGYLFVSGIVDPNSIDLSDGVFKKSKFSSLQKAFIKSLRLIISLNIERKNICLEDKAIITFISLGQFFDTYSIENITETDSCQIVYAILSAIFNAPSFVFHTNTPLAHLDPINHLNKRLECVCGDRNLQPSVVFTFKPQEEDIFSWSTVYTPLTRKIKKAKELKNDQNISLSTLNNRSKEENSQSYKSEFGSLEISHSSSTEKNVFSDESGISQKEKDNSKSSKGDAVSSHPHVNTKEMEKDGESSKNSSYSVTNNEQSSFSETSSSSFSTGEEITTTSISEKGKSPDDQMTDKNKEIESIYRTSDQQNITSNRFSSNQSNLEEKDILSLPHNSKITSSSNLSKDEVVYDFSKLKELYRQLKKMEKKNIKYDREIVQNLFLS